jgi:uncharacterized protein
MNLISNTSLQVASSESILWRGDFLPGHEACRLFSSGSQRHLEGTAVFSHEGLPCRLDYHILCDAEWRTLSADVEGWVGNTNIEIHLQVTPEGHWLLNGVDQPALAGCIDVDLNFSPSTNLLPIHRLNLAIGKTAQIKAAWLRFPSFRLEPLEQTYTRLSELVYRYESSNGKFMADLKVNAAGFVIDYPNIWKSEAVYENAG